MDKKVILLIVIIVIAVIAVYLTFVYARPCSDKACFESSMQNCQRVSFIDDAADATWRYQIKGKDKDSCNIEVSLLYLKQGTSDMSILQDKNMICEIPLGVVGSPQENLQRCHGSLKEMLQEMIIKKLHNYITENLGEIKQELNSAF